MTRTNLLTLAAALLILGGLAGGEATGDESPVATATEDAKPAFVSASGKGSGPFRIDYAIIDLQIHSALGPGPVEISYQVADPSAIAFHEAQPEALLTELAANEPFVSERVTIIPQREGRLFLNVSAAVDTEEGRISTVTSIPIHVGEVSTAPSPQGVLETDEEGEAVRVLSGD